MNKTLLGAVVFFSVVVLAAGAEPGSVTAVQEALKKRGFYFDQPTGQMDEPTRAALKRFQIREGLNVTGEIDAATSETLQNQPGAAASAPPSRPEAASDVPARERSRNIVQSDRDFLDRIEPGDPPELTRPAPPPTRPPSPPPRATPLPRETPPDRVPSSPDRPTEVEGAPRISQAEARDFVERYIAAAQAPNPDRELRFYADEVNYFDTGRVNRAHIERDQRSYYRRWPIREFRLLSAPEVTATSPDAATVRYRLRYVVRNGESVAKGETENFVRIARTDSGLKIVRIRERKLGN